MDNTIYLLCVEKERLSGGVHYQPVVDSDTSEKDVDLVCCDNLITLQRENRDIINSLIHNCENIMFIPVSLEIYQELRNHLKDSIDKAQQALTSAYEALKKAYEIMGREMNVEESVSDTTRNLLNNSSSGGKCLDEELNIVNCDSSYKENYYEDFEEEEDYEDDYYDEDEDEDGWD